MKKLLLAFLLLSFPAVMSATPPSDILFSFDLKNSMVKVDIIHETRDPLKHFIYNIVVKVNGKKAVTQTAYQQAGMARLCLLHHVNGQKAERVYGKLVYVLLFFRHISPVLTQMTQLTHVAQPALVLPLSIESNESVESIESVLPALKTKGASIIIP